MSEPWIIKKQQNRTKPKKMLEIELYRYRDLTLVGKIIYQDESLRCKGTICDTGGFAIKSNLYPAIGNDNKLFIRGGQRELFIRGGQRDLDDTAMCGRFSSKTDLDKYIINLKKALNKLNGGVCTERVLEKVFTKVL